jgi:hypothetical protein
MTLVLDSLYSLVSGAIRYMSLRSGPEGEAEMTNRPAEWMRAEDDQLRAAAALGESIAEIAKRICRSESGVRHRADKLGIKLARRQRSRSPRRLVELELKVKAK